LFGLRIAATIFVAHRVQTQTMAVFQVPSILITDDDTPFRDTIRDMLEPCGYRLSLASSGEEALEIVERQDIHLLLLDMHMSRLTGLETARRVYQRKLALPWILMSARVDEDLMQQAQQADVFTVLRKPVDRTTITSNVALALRQRYDWSPGGGYRLDIVKNRP
jgi:CheY-like chemotaxis protein